MTDTMAWRRSGSKDRLVRFALLFALITGWTFLVRYEETRIAAEADSATRLLLSDFSRSLGRGGV
ncbi:MAG TPA: hypothetical protein VFY29_01350 [Terriglobia bacterium]|nr:hypothetical protein [Terriglobia bacterium]